VLAIFDGSVSGEPQILILNKMMESPCFRGLLQIKSFADDRANPESGSDWRSNT